MARPVPATISQPSYVQPSSAPFHQQIVGYEMRAITPEYNSFDIVGSVLLAASIIGYLGVVATGTAVGVGAIAFGTAAVSGNIVLGGIGGTAVVVGGCALIGCAIEYAVSDVLYHAYMDYQYLTTYEIVPKMIDYPTDYTVSEHVYTPVETIEA